MERYQRQIILPEIGEAGQRKLQAAKVLIIGVGGLGSPIALYLTGAGVGTLGLVDDDEVSITNLQRQILYNESELGKKKVLCAKSHLEALNKEVKIEAHSCRLTPENAENIISRYDIIVDGCDNFATRYLISDTCTKLGKPYVYGAICSFDGQVSVFNHQTNVTYRTLYPDETEMLAMPHPSKGVMGITPAIVGSVEAAEVIKVICSFGEVLSGKLWTIDVRTMQTNIILL